MVQLKPDQLRKRVTLNSQKFVLADEIKVYPVESESQAIRTIGLQQRQNNRKINKLVRDWSDGLGYSRLRRDTNVGINGLRDADAETRFNAEITLPLNPQTETHAATADHLIAYEHFKGNLYGLFESDFDDSAASVLYMGTFGASSDTWAPGGIPTRIATASAATTGATSLTASLASTTASTCIIVFVAFGVATGVTWNGNAMTDQGSGGAIEIFSIIGSDTGTHDVVASFSGSTVANLIAIAYKGVAAVSGFAAPSAEADTGNIFDDITTAAEGSLVVSGVKSNENETFTHTAGFTELIDAVSQSTVAYSVAEGRGDTDLTTRIRHDGSHGTSDMTMASLSLDGGGLVAFNETVAEGVRAFGSTVHKGSMYVVGTHSGGETAYRVYSTADGDGWDSVTPSGTNWPTAAYLQTSVTRANDWSQKYADIISFGSNLIVALYEDPDSSGGSISQVRIGYSANLGVTWTFNAGLIIPATDTPNITLIATRDIFSSNSELVPALVTSDNIYLLDIANNTYQPMLPLGILSGTANEALAAASGSDGALYVSKASGDILRINIPTAGVIDIINIGPQSKSGNKESDGLVSDRQGHANFIWGSDPRWLFVSYGGHASGKYGAILCFDYRSGAWHSFYKDGTADRDSNRVIGSTEDDGVSRLHISTEAAAASVLQMFEEPFVSAVTGATQQFRSTGYVEWAEDDLGDPHADSALLTIRVDADDLDNVSTIEGGSGTSTDVEIEYGVNGAAWDNVSTLGFFASDDPTLYFGKSNQTTPGASESGTPIGVSAKTFRMRAELKRDGTSTNTPKIKEIQTDHINKSDDLNGFVLAIDVGSTALDQQINPEVVLDRIDTIKKAVTSVALEFGQETDGSNTTYYVEYVRKGQFDSESVLPQGVSIGAITESTVNIGTVVLYLEERIDV